MRKFITQDGNIIYSRDHEPEPEVAAAIAATAVEPQYHCDCHTRMGNDFWFLPAGQCLRDDKTCNAKVPL